MTADKRIAYGSTCTWWGPVGSAGRGKGLFPLPCCPFCGGPLFEMPTEQDWMAFAHRHAERMEDPGYVDLIVWLKGRPCLSMNTPDGDLTAYERLRAQYEAEKGAT